VDGFKGNIVGNRKVNAIRRYALKHDLDAFFGAEVNINWKKMPESGQLLELFRSEMPSIQFPHTINSKIGEDSSKAGRSVWLLDS
jgi:hypothetical protein